MWASGKNMQKNMPKYIKNPKGREKNSGKDKTGVDIKHQLLS